jgi:hypothetical protein
MEKGESYPKYKYNKKPLNTAMIQNSNHNEKQIQVPVYDTRMQAMRTLLAELES